jgi:hypothetical protein
MSGTQKPLHPTQLLDAITPVLILVTLIKLLGNNKLSAVFAFPFTLGLYALTRFMTERDTKSNHSPIPRNGKRPIFAESKDFEGYGRLIIVWVRTFDYGKFRDIRWQHLIVIHYATFSVNRHCCNNPA